jgi:hypothetical protein
MTTRPSGDAVLDTVYCRRGTAQTWYAGPQAVAIDDSADGDVANVRCGRAVKIGGGSKSALRHQTSISRKSHFARKRLAVSPV